jgi:hypothetical protein
MSTQLPTMYVLAGKRGKINDYWYESQIPTLELAEQKASEHPEVDTIIEYKTYIDSTGRPNGYVPSGKSWLAHPNQPDQEGK